ncbi:MAG: SBBP repeat-containing protein [Taibaiella sp.]|jgi:hypothetical protein
MKQIYFGVVAIMLLLIQGNIANGQQPDHYSKLNTRALLFIENKGQIKDQYKNSRPDIDFVLHGNGLNIFISAGRISYQFIKGNTGKDAAQKLKEYNDSKFAFTQAYNISDQAYTLYRLDMELRGANFNSTPATGAPTISKFNYYLAGSDENGITQVAGFDHITYTDIYPGIDWVVYIKDNKLKYDFIIHEGALSENIAIQYNGATKQELTEDGSLNISTPLGTIKEETPVAWTASEHKNIAVKFEPKNGGWGFTTDPWKGTLVLDPGLSWSTYYGGSGLEVTKDICTNNGSIYVTGLTTSLDQIATTGTYQTNYYGGVEGDAFLARFTGEGTLLWATYYGGDSNDLGWSIVADAFGNVYMAGYTESSVGIATAGSYQPVFGSGTTDAFLAKFSATGQRVWSTYYGGSAPDYGHSIAIDGVYLYMCGLTYSNSMSTAGSYQSVLTSYGGNTGNAFLVKWDTDGHRQWATYYGAGTTTGNSVTVDQNHNVYLTGGTNAPADISTAGSHQSSYGGFSDNYLAKFNAAGQRQWATYFGGTAAESTFPVALVGDHNNIYLAGITYSYNQIATPGTSRPVYSFGIDGYLASFTAAGVQEWGTYVGPGNVTNGVYVSDIALGNCGDVYVTGDVFPSVGLNPTEDAYKQTPGGGTFDGALIRYDPQGKSTYCSYIGGAEEDNMSAIAMDNAGNLYLAGMTASDSGIATDSIHQSAFAGIKDAFLMKFLDVFVGDKENPNGIFDSVRCINDTFAVPYTITATFQAGNVFTAELSNNNGSFANPVIIGTYAATTNGIIQCSIPQTVPPGGGYRLRISGSLPATKGSCSLPLFLNLPPIPEITIQGDTLISSSAINYQWIKNGTPLSGATNQRLITSASGWYKISVTDPVTGCTSYSDSVAIGNVGIDQLPDIRSFLQVYPNPFDRQIQVTIASSLVNVQSYTLTVSTPLGKKIKVLSGLQYKNKIDLAELAAGIYFMEISGPAGKSVFKVVKRL